MQYRLFHIALPALMQGMLSLTICYAYSFLTAVYIFHYRCHTTSISSNLQRQGTEPVPILPAETQACCRCFRVNAVKSFFRRAPCCDARSDVIDNVLCLFLANFAVYFFGAVVIEARYATFKIKVQSLPLYHKSRLSRAIDVLQCSAMSRRSFTLSLRFDVWSSSRLQTLPLLMSGVASLQNVPGMHPNVSLNNRTFVQR